MSLPFHPYPLTLTENSLKIMATPGSSFTPTPLGHEDNLE
ncbi:hypothetical protein TNCV_2540961, partial [Trichonephila clavipes]